MLPGIAPYIIDEKQYAALIYPRSRNYQPNESWDRGGVALSDPSEGIFGYIWRAWIDADNIYVERVDQGIPFLVLTDVDITEVDLTFDQNMRVCVTYVSAGDVKLYWYDGSVQKMATTTYTGITNPCVSLDDRREFNINNSDIIFAYVKGNQLCCRFQRDRYITEHILVTDDTREQLWRIGMGRDNRFLFYWR